MVVFPKVSPSYYELPSDPDERREALLGIFGQHLCWSRNLAVARLEDRLASHSIENEPDETRRQVYERIAGLRPEDRKLVLEAADLAIDTFTMFMLALLANIGTDLLQDDSHAVWYKLVAEVFDINAGEVVEEMVLNRDQLEFLPEYLPKWIMEYRTRK